MRCSGFGLAPVRPFAAESFTFGGTREHLSRDRLFQQIRCMSNSIIDFSHLTPAERIELAEQLWDSLEPREREAAISPADEQLALLRQRRAALDADGDLGEPWEDVLDQIEARDL